MDLGRFFVTTAIDYVNSAPHIGHAYEKIAADILARYWRTRGAEVFMLVGTDEHGLKVAQAARRANKDPKAFADEVSLKYKAAWSALNIQYDNFIRTTDDYHEKFVKNFLQKLYDNNELYRDKYQGLYCIGCEEYKVEEELGPNQTCPIHKSQCQLVQEDIWFLKLSKYQDKIVESIQSRKMQIEPESRRNEIFKFLAKEPLRDLAISRTKVPWGIELPWDREQTVYVWVDALLNYISGSRGLWPPQLQLIGKDIFRFHAIIWPAMLLAGGYELPEKIFIHGFINIEGQKISKTAGNVIDPILIAKKYGPDALRYFLFREVPFGQDGTFSWERFKIRYEADLANDLGNLVQRVLVMKNKYQIKWEYRLSDKVFCEINKAIEELRFSDALNLIWAMITEANQRIDMERPWDLAKSDRQRLENLICALLETISHISNLIKPFMPETSRKIIDQLEKEEIKPLFPKK